MVSADLESQMMQTGGVVGGGPPDPLGSSESGYLRGLGGPGGYPHPEGLSGHPLHPQMQIYEDDNEEKRTTNMNMGPRTWYQVPPRDLRYPEDPHLQYGLPSMSQSQSGMKRTSDGAGLESMMGDGGSSDEDSCQDQKPLIHSSPGHHSSGGVDHDGYGPGPGSHGQSAGRGKQSPGGPPTPAGKKTKGRVKIKMEFIDNKLRRYTTFSKRKTGIMKKAYELSTLTGTQVMLLVASETGHVYTFATRKLQPMITSDAGKALIQTCLNSPDPPPMPPSADQRMSATGYEETELTYNVNEEEQQKVRQMMYSTHYSSHPGQHTHNLFSPASSGYPPNLSHSPYITPHPAPSPSPSHHGHPGYGGVSLSPSLSHSPTHPPFSSHPSQHHPSR